MRQVTNYQTKEYKRTLAERWKAILAEIDPPQKRQPQVSGGLSYSYIAWDDLAECLRPLLAKHGILIDVEIIDVELTERGGGSDRVSYHALVKMLIHRITEEGEIDTRSWYGQAVDHRPGDKAIQKAVTIGVKYWLLKVLCIGDPETDETGIIEENGRHQKIDHRAAIKSLQPQPVPTVQTQAQELVKRKRGRPPKKEAVESSPVEEPPVEEPPVGESSELNGQLSMVSPDGFLGLSVEQAREALLGCVSWLDSEQTLRLIDSLKNTGLRLMEIKNYDYQELDRFREVLIQQGIEPDTLLKLAEKQHSAAVSLQVQKELPEEVRNKVSSDLIACGLLLAKLPRWE